MDEILIDGSFGEGGGQILRSSLLFSTLLKRPVKVVNIRAKRSNPGLRPQHLATIKAFVEITGGRAEGLSIGSTVIRYFPGDELKSSLQIDVGTAGSITLMLQSLIPALGLKKREIRLKLIGGTDTKWSPTMEYFKRIVLQFFNLIGLSVSLKVLRRGYYPHGGGIVDVTIGKDKGLKTFEAVNVEKSAKAEIVSICSKLPKSVAERQAKSAMAMLRDAGIDVKNVEIYVESSVSPGTSILVYSMKPEIFYFIGGDSVGEKGVPAEEIGRRAAAAYLEEVNVVVDRHLADMVVPLAAVAPGRSRMLTSELTGHLSTNLHIAKMFTGCEYSVEKVEGGVVVEIEGKGEIL